MVEGDKVEYQGNYYWVKAVIKIPSREPLLLLKGTGEDACIEVSAPQCKKVEVW